MHPAGARRGQVGRAHADGRLPHPPGQIGQSLAKFFGVGYEPFNAGRIRSEMLHGALKREFIGQQGWIPLEETPTAW
jgi:hypothetical protein